MPVRINPSILAADFANFEAELGRVAGADHVHFDVMDNHFVPSLTFGLPLLQRLQQVTALPMDVHLMIEDPQRWAPEFAEAGAFSVTFHAESCANPVLVARRLRGIGARAGLAVKPHTDVEPYLELLAEFDQLLVMTVEPGFGGQKFLPETLPKLRRASQAIRSSGLDVWLQVDGGITEETIAMAASAGADTFVAGSSVFGAENPDAQIARLRDAATRVQSSGDS